MSVGQIAIAATRRGSRGQIGMLKTCPTLFVLILFGVDDELIDAVRKPAIAKGGMALAAGELTLRTCWQDHDKKGGSGVDFKKIDNHPLGSSGLQLRVQMNELLAGYAPGRIVRVRPNSFPNVKLPPEERVKNMDERISKPYAP